MENIFAERLKKLRTDSEMSQTELAKALKVYQQNIDRWERGLIKPNMDTIIQLSIIFRVSSDYLLGLSNDISKIEVGHRAKNSFNNSHINIHNGNKN